MFARQARRYFRIIRDRTVTVTTPVLRPKATELANLLAERIRGLDETTIVRLLGDLRGHRGAG